MCITVSSWISHYPKDMSFREVVIHGLNEVELEKNPVATRYFVRNLNAEPHLTECETASFDAVTCCVSVQYLQKPVAVFKEVERVLRPGGSFIVSYVRD